MDIRTSGSINYISTNNSSTTPLGSSGVFTGTADYALLYKTVAISAFADTNSANNGLSIQFSTDNVNWDFQFNFTITANIGFAQVIQVVAPYFRIVYTNGGSAQSVFRLQSRLLSSQNSDIVTYPAANATPTPVTLTGPQDSFGNVPVSLLESSSNMSFKYGLISSRVAATTVTGTGSVTPSNSMAALSAGPGTGTAQVRSVEIVDYLPGTGLRAYITGIFNSGVSGTTQRIGIGSENDGYFFGYNGTNFCIVHRRAGTDTYINQSNWNVDPMNGSGPTGLTINPQTGNVYIIQVQWLGFGSIRFSVEIPTGGYQLVHIIQYPNSYTVPSLAIPGFYGRAFIDNGASGASMTLNVACVASYNEGNTINRRGIYNAINNFASTSTGAIQNILTIRNNTTFNSLVNVSNVRLRLMSFSSEGNKPVRFGVRLNCTETFTYTNISSTSCVSYATNLITIASGTLIFSFFLGKSESQIVNLNDNFVNIAPGETLTFTAYTTNATNENSVAVTWSEYQ